MREDAGDYVVDDASDFPISQKKNGQWNGSNENCIGLTNEIMMMMHLYVVNNCVAHSFWEKHENENDEK